MSQVPDPPTITIEQPPAGKSFGVTSIVVVRGRVKWSTDQPALVASLRVQVLRSDGTVATSAGFADQASVTPTSFSWSRSFLADRVVVGGSLAALALDSTGQEVGRALIPLAITPPEITITVARPVLHSTVAIDQPVEVGGEVAWTPPRTNPVDAVRVSLLENPGATASPLAVGLAQRTVAISGRFSWVHTVVPSVALDQATLLVQALDINEKILASDRATQFEVVIPQKPTITIGTPPPNTTFGVDKPITVAGSVQWDPPAPEYVRSVRLLLIRQQDQFVADDRPAQFDSTSINSIAWSGVLETDQSLQDAKIMVSAFNQFNEQVARSDVAVKVL